MGIRSLKWSGRRRLFHGIYFFGSFNVSEDVRNTVKDPLKEITLDGVRPTTPLLPFLKPLFISYLDKDFPTY